MFEVGKQYSLVTLVHDKNGYHQSSDDVTVTKVEGNLVQYNGHTIINTASPLFHSATDIEAEKASADNAEREFSVSKFYEDPA